MYFVQLPRSRKELPVVRLRRVVHRRPILAYMRHLRNRHLGIVFRPYMLQPHVRTAHRRLPEIVHTMCRELRACNLGARALVPVEIHEELAEDVETAQLVEHRHRERPCIGTEMDDCASARERRFPCCLAGGRIERVVYAVFMEEAGVGERREGPVHREVGPMVCWAQKSKGEWYNSGKAFPRLHSLYTGGVAVDIRDRIRTRPATHTASRPKATRRKRAGSIGDGERFRAQSGNRSAIELDGPAPMS